MPGIFTREFNFVLSVALYCPTNESECALDSCFSENQFEFVPFNSEVESLKLHIALTTLRRRFLWAVGLGALAEWI